MRRFLAVLGAMWRLGLAEAFAYRVAMLVWVLTTTFPLVSLTLWHSLAEKGPIGGFTQGEFDAYFVAAFLIRQLTASWVVWDLSSQIRDGSLSTLLMRPVHPLLHHLMSNLAALPVRVVLAVPLGLVVLFAVGGIEAGFGWHVVVTPLAIVLAWLLQLCVQICVACLAFWVTSSAALFEVWLGLYMVLSGYVMPTGLLPWGAGVVRALPFHAAMGFPTELLCGRLSGGEIVRGFALQGIWLVVFAALAAWLWRRGLRVYGAVGA